jgi:ribonuclease E
MLAQLVKEARGNKGAALTSHLSLAGRYCVLMPNTARGGGISRKITDMSDRKRLKELVREIEVPEGMGLIVRTAGAQRTKTEIKRDYDYLLRVWENVRDLTLTSTAPSLDYEEGSLIKRAIRDLYNKDVEDVVVDSRPATPCASALRASCFGRPPPPVIPPPHRAKKSSSVSGARCRKPPGVASWRL